MRVAINGERRELAAKLSLQELVEFLKLKPEQIAIELNQVVVRRAEWAATMLKEDDRIEIVHFVGGGSGQYAGGRVSRQGQSAGAVGRRQVPAPAYCCCQLPTVQFWFLLLPTAFCSILFRHDRV